MRKSTFLTALITVLLSVCSINCESDAKKWKSPNAWGDELPHWDNEATSVIATQPPSVCPVCEEIRPGNTPDGIAFKYYKKFAATLFNRNKLVYDENAALYQRTLVFSLLPAQLEKLESLSDPRDLDCLLTEIIAAAKTINKFGERVDSNANVWVLIKDMAKDALLLLKISEVRFTLMAASVIIFYWFLHKRYHTGILTLTVSSFFLLGYFLTYLECNRNLEIDELVEYVSDDSSKAKGFFSNWFSTKTRKPDIEKLKKSRKLKLPFCRPDHVLLMYANELFLKQLEYLIEKFTNTMSQFSTTLAFPYNIIAPCLLVALMCYLLKLTYKYILTPKAWASLWNAGQAPHPQTIPTAFIRPGNAAIDTADRLSGENLNLLLHVIKDAKLNATVGNIIEEKPAAAAVSGVEDVLEQIEYKDGKDAVLGDACATDKPKTAKPSLKNVSSKSKSFSESEVT